MSSPQAAIPSRDTEAHAARRFSLLWWVFLVNCFVLLIAALLLAVTPITISHPIALWQLIVLLAGLAVMLMVNLVMLRGVLSPFFKLTSVMSAIDPDRPGRRLSGLDPRSLEGAALVNAFNAMLDRLESARRNAARTALAAQEGERLRIAQELHDEIGQTLTAVMIQAERASGGDESLASRELARVTDAIRESLDEVRRIARELRPEALDDLGLVNALIALCSRMDDQEGMRVRRDLQGKLPPMSQDVELVIYRIAQEGLTNALRHSGADEATVCLRAEAGRVTLRVTDDGDGLPAKITSGTAGIAGMRERALLVDGRLSIESQPGDGTELRLVVPLDGEQP
jgi:two-component system sensor histidine kinase UhpB